MLIAALLAIANPAPAAEVEMWRLDCGAFNGADFSWFSDTHRYDGQKRDLVVSCYLIRHGDQYLVWDTGVGEKALNGRPTVLAQLAQIGVKPEQVKFVGISHRHSDHTGQALSFPGATLLIGAEDFETLKGSKDPGDRAGLLPWLDGGAKAQMVTGDWNIFGDGSVMMLNMPGHTAGHHSLLVKLKERGWVLLSGDLFHARESYEFDQVPAFNVNRADTLASIGRFKGIATNLRATVIVQHEKLDVDKLPAFPASAR